MEKMKDAFNEKKKWETKGYKLPEQKTAYPKLMENETINQVNESTD